MTDCSGLGGFSHFGDYAQLLRNRTSFSAPRLEECQIPICSALWGFGVPDLSGIGVAVGYTLSVFLGPFLSTVLLSTSPLAFRIQTTATAALAAFFDSGVYFAFAIQVATITTLAPKDYETKETSIGDYESRTAGLVSIICLLPLLYPIAILPFSPNRLIQTRTPYRLTLFCLAVVISFYPFLSQSIRNFAPTQVGAGNGEQGETYVTAAEWAAVERLCFGEGISYLTKREHKILRAFQIVASLTIFLFTIGAIIPPGLRRLNYLYGSDSPLRNDWLGKVEWATTKVSNNAWLRYMLLSVPTLLAVPLLWGFFKLRTLQGQLAKRTGGDEEANLWEFGQVMAITIFVPVLAELIFVAVRRGGRADVRSAGDDVIKGDYTEQKQGLCLFWNH
ncbi:hypothetical protein QBC35DRAFT_383296 [Podospora australis]|uniref:Uncharacterized protein n=1 Tax=Podospora australis TaxID=1536484 RepID=A0AAN6WUC7_9PEZI|nr:hypothetical protein QBC35DRAFT_383296 [Podospora australis]